MILLFDRFKISSFTSEYKSLGKKEISRPLKSNLVSLFLLARLSTRVSYAINLKFARFLTLYKYSSLVIQLINYKKL